MFRLYCVFLNNGQKRSYMVEKCCCGLLILLFSAVQAFAQSDAVAAFDSGYVETGNPFFLHLSVPQQFGEPAKVDLSSWSNVFPEQNILGQTGWQQHNGRWVSDLNLIAFDSAELQLPPVGIVFPGGDTLKTNVLALRVLPTPSPDDPADMQDIKDIYREPVNWRDYLWPALPIVVGVLILALAIALVLLLRKKKSGLKGIHTIQQPAHEVALQRLNKLEKQQPREQEEIKLYYSELTHIIREYLERRYHIPALESLSEEILHRLVRTDFPASLLSSLSELLRWADLAKFAKGTPPAQFHAKALSEARQLIEQSRYRQPESIPASRQNGTSVTPPRNNPPATHPPT